MPPGEPSLAAERVREHRKVSELVDLLFSRLPWQERSWLECHEASMLDWGYASAERVNELARRYPHCRVAGVMPSRRAAGAASQRYPLNLFLTAENGDLPSFDVIVSCGLLERQEEPLAFLKQQLRRCRCFLMTLVPATQGGPEERLVASFDEASLPADLDGFERIITTRFRTQPTADGDGVLMAVYGHPEYLRLRPAEVMAPDEQQKWERYYLGSAVAGGDGGPEIAALGDELAELLTNLLPSEASLLEAGCGAGLQSLRLAKRGFRNLTLLDFSPAALRHARSAFEGVGLGVALEAGDIAIPGAPKYDLVFNAGVLEHYEAATQVELVRGMASRSRDLVLVLVPNRLCTWYWLWRLQESTKGRWAYGQEVPLVDLSAIFSEAGVEYIGRAFVGGRWAEHCIRGLEGIDEQALARMLALHRSPVLPPSTSSYLVAFLGTVNPGSRRASSHWEKSPPIGPEEDPRRVAAEADDLARSLGTDVTSVGLGHGQPNEASAAPRSPVVSGRYDGARCSPEAATSAVEPDEPPQARENRLAVARKRDHRRLLELESTLGSTIAALEDMASTMESTRRALIASGISVRSSLARTEAEKADLRAALEEAKGELHSIYASRGGRALAGYWRLVGHVRRLPRRFASALWRRLAPAAWQHFADRARWGPLRSWYALSFDRYREARQTMVPEAFTTLRVPASDAISIVLPVYNGERYLAESLDSVLGQTLAGWEALVVDDGSTDRTPVIAAAYAARDERIRVIRQQNQRLPRALSRGSWEVRGRLMTWTSDDNRLHPSFLERMSACLERHPGYDAVYSNLDIIGPEGEPLRQSNWYHLYQRPTGSEHIHLPADLSELNVWPNNYVGASFLYHARVPWLIGDYSPHRFGTEDYDFWMRVNALLTLRHTDFPEPVYEYRFHEQSLTARDDELGITRSRDGLMVFEDARRDFNLTPLVWCIESKGSRAERLAAMLRARAKSAGHVIVGPDELSPEHLPPLWVPVVRLQVVDSTAEATPPPPLPGTWRALVVASEAPLPQSVSPEWDVCCAVPGPTELPRLHGYHGWIAAPDAAVTFAALDVRTRAAHAQRLEDAIFSPSTPRLAVSVVICTLRGGERLERVVEAVAAQTTKASFELILVDNSLRERTLTSQAASLRRRLFPDEPGRLRVVHCPILGLSQARNAGIGASDAEIVAFLDDDAIPASDWLERIVAAFATDAKIGVVGGHIELTPERERRPAAAPGWERYWSHFVTTHEELTTVEPWWELPWGANWAARRRTLLEIGGFRCSYGRRANDFSGGEELVAARLAQELGYRVCVEPRARVLHDVAPSRMTFRHVRRTIIAAQLVHYRAQRDLYVPMESDLKSTWRSVFREQFECGRTPGVGRWNALRHWFYRRLAALRLLREQLGDLWRRTQSPPEEAG
jgi:glycosyltransferase involved in cell wall biosynthesis/SAM-dependent methyltransferase